MIVELKDIPQEGKPFSGTEPAGILALDGASEIESWGAVSYDLRVYLVDGELIVRGRLAADVTFVCSRCAESFKLAVAEPAFACSHDVSPRAAASGKRSGRRRRTPANLEKPESVDLTGDIREAILLAFPSHPLCRSDCKGLCSQCGTNLNSGRCDCSAPPDERWSTLDHLELMKGTTNGRTETEKIKEQDP